MLNCLMYFLYALLTKYVFKPNAKRSFMRDNLIRWGYFDPLITLHFLIKLIKMCPARKNG